MRISDWSSDVCSSDLLIYSLTTSFMSFRLVPPTPPRFVGLDNYASLLQQPRFWNVVATTTAISFIAVALQYAIGFACALALHAKVPGERLLRVGLLLPMLLAPVAVALIRSEEHTSELQSLMRNVYTVFCL